MINLDTTSGLMFVCVAAAAAVYFGRQYRRRQNVDADDEYEKEGNQQSLISKFRNPFKRNTNSNNNNVDDELINF